jgi:hypothetical protein
MDLPLVLRRPKGYRTFTDIVTAFGATFSVVHFAFTYPKLGDYARVPQQFDVFGNVNWTAPKIGLLIYPALSVLVPFLLRVGY